MIKIFRERYVEKLLRDAGKQLSLYQRPESWVLSQAPKSETTLETGLQFREELDLIMPDKEGLHDLENSIRVHRSLPKLTRLQARDPRLWTRLCHVECWPYMVKRWPISQNGENEKKQENKVLSRYFVRQSQSRALLRNGVSRLWWIAELTFDPLRDNPYELTSVLLATLDITQTIMERNFGRSNNIATAMLEIIQAKRDLLIEEGNTSRLRVRELGKFINMQGGLTVIDMLPKDEIKRLLEAQLGIIIAAEADALTENAAVVEEDADAD
jgi:hypothetical protein